MFNGILFQQSLQDLVKGIRAHRRDEEEYIRSKVAEIAEECRGADMAKKTTAVLKLTHLQMMGHSVGFASFHIVEVMSSPVFASKRIGYLAAAQSFSPTTDVLLLTTNQFKKDLTNGKLQDCSQALTCLAKLVTEDLGRDLEHDVSLLLNSPRPYIRKKALLVLFRLIMVHPDTLPVVSQRFKDRLVDSDPGVVCAAVTVTCELARASPKSFLSLAPLLYQLLTNKESNNWMLIKIVKLMGVLTPLEPRLGKKLVEPLTTLMRTTRAKSLLYECCSTVTSGLMAHPEAVELCAQRLGEFMDESDQNLKYLGLLSMKKLIQAHPHLALEHRDNILDCLDDEDIGIRMRALELVSEFITKRTLRDISRILLKKLRKASAEGFSTDAVILNGQRETFSDSTSAYMPVTDQEAPYRQSLARQLLKAGEYKRSAQTAKSGYDMLLTGDDFAWYTTAILGGLAEIPLLSNEIRNKIGDQLLELTSRVEALRPISVKVALSLLSARRKMSAVRAIVDQKETVSAEDMLGVEENGEPKNATESDTQINGISKNPDQPIGACSQSSDEALLPPTLAASNAWVVGEYSELIEDPVAAAEILISFPRKGLDSADQVRILTAAMKVYASCHEDDASRLHNVIRRFVDSLVDNQFAEVQERAWIFKTLLTACVEGSGNPLAALFEGKLIPVDYRAQSKIPVGGGLDLNQPLLDTGSDSLFTHLLKTIETKVDDGDGGDDDNLFREAVFANSTLSFSGVQMGSSNSASGHGPLLAGLPEAVDRGNNPYYLGATSRSNTDAKTQQDQLSMTESKSPQQFKYDIPQLSTEAAAVLAEESPSGLKLSDDERELLQSEVKPADERLEAAFKGAFDGTNSKETGKDGKRKKKKKKKSKKDRDSASHKGRDGKEPAVEVSLIDFEDASATSSSREEAPSSFVCRAISLEVLTWLD
ncbi:unnamed protein product [Chondrus crispus]|uniref:AP-3 complex subunit delta n=1 Tax=Chondrus crispus TaxID=2769 RepID=R7Q519_CHOCR|nr:unnamed protein product [Chondrus crispus]CDF32456.1 unnamed protein product [Chondrus crispus]|eukprot:XP_005712121.1 unnamed protein product [Chondrus crispus]